jgi:hypothetical protein
VSSILDCWERELVGGIGEGGWDSTHDCLVEVAFALEGVAEVFAEFFVVGHSAGGICCRSGAAWWGVFGHYDWDHGVGKAADEVRELRLN